jgi:hypothetical protein
MGKNAVQLHQTASRTFQALGGAYLSAEIMAKRMYERLGQVFADKELDYYSQFVVVDKRAPRYPTFEELHVLLPPTGNRIYDWYLEAARSKKTPTGISDYDRNTRERQSVQFFTSFTHDHH